ncbi:MULTISPECIES: hypothetical protein [unclassified Frigoribacterium]|jgi:hypothetical protein|uniref:hypothetical protein n=1 Tax=unclassified Frigoribacterium TaxID=2627005 RepID=UPI0006F8CF04|nr:MULTISPECIES: hypothetical protein [unclassified Frigoribacterium]KQO82456.1 hypothetical protein ASF17_05095 [Frigoribacterium sp. Leaf263]KQR64860.1 hypothetical protein ASF89_10525 [Frigoribacterium sp. Leaf172]
MLILRCTDTLSGVGRGYTCLVDVRTLRHLSTSAMVSSLKSIGVTYREVNSVGFYNVLSSMSVPKAAVKKSADYSGR